jgi:hypothetical protein
MKKLVLIISLLFSTVICFSQASIGGDGAVHPTGNFPVALSGEIKGSMKRVKDTIQRNAIPASFRDTGMFCYVTSLKKTYQLQDGIANSNWVEYKSGSSYKQGIAIVIGTDTTINADTANVLLSKSNATNTYVPKVRKINNKALTTDITLDKTDINLSNVDNTSDVNKPISFAQGTAINAKMDTGKQSVAGTIAYFRKRTVYDTSIQYTVIDYRKGGIFKYVATDSTSGDNTGDTLKTGNNRRLYRLRPKETEVNIDWYIEDSERVVNDYSKAWIRAKAALPNGGTIYFGTGVYGSKTSWLLEKSNLTMQGAGMDSTIVTADASVGTIMFNVSRTADGYDLGIRSIDTANVFTFWNTTRKGDAFLKLKDAAFASKFKQGMIAKLVAGSHYLDQQFGELNKVRGIGHDTVYLEHPLAREYAVDSSIYSGDFNTNNVIMPAVGDTVQIAITGGIMPAVGFFYNFGDNIFATTRVNVATSIVTFRNIGKGNSLNPGDTLKAGTHLMKGRQLMISFHTQNLTINDLTITGTNSRTFQFDNVYGGRFNRVKIIRNSTPDNGFIYSADWTRDCQFENCVIASGNGTQAGSQISRSTGDLLFHKSQFVNVPFDISEMSFNTVVDDCDITSSNMDFAIRMGKSTSSSTIKNSRINANSCAQIISMDDIQGINNIQREGANFINNTVNSKGSSIAVYFTNGGKMVVSNNTWNGDLYSFTSSLPKQEDTIGTYTYPTSVEINDNLFNNTWGNFVFVGGAFNLIMKNNYFKYPAKDTNNVIWQQFYNNINQTDIKNIDISNNTFDNYYYDDTYFDLGIKLSENIRIKDNHFIHARGTRLSEFWVSYGAKSSTHALSDIYAPLIYSPALDSAMYVNRILNIGGDTTGVYRVGKVLRSIYANGLRSKLLVWYPFLGDSLAALVPAIGYEVGGFEEYKRTSRRAIVVGSGITYNPLLGFAGTASGKTGIIIAKSGDIDYKNVGYFIQETKPGTTLNPYYVGGNNQGIRRSSSSNTLSGLGGSTIIQPFTEDTAFLYSGRNQYNNSQLNYYDNGGTRIDFNNSTFGVLTIAPAPTVLFNRNGYDSPTDASFGTAGITRGDLTISEVKTLKTIMRNYMQDIGRPVQTGSPDAILAGDADTLIQVVAGGDILRLPYRSSGSTIDTTSLSNRINIATNKVNPLETVLNTGNTLTKSNSINAGDSTFGVNAGTFYVRGKGLNTKFGVIHVPNTLSANVAHLLGFPVVRSNWTYPNATVPFATTLIANPDLEGLPTINSVPLDRTRQYLTADSVDNYFIPKLITVLDTTKNRNIKTYVIDNEEVNDTYRPLDTVETPKRYLYTLSAFTKTVHGYDKKVANGGFTGQAPLWFVWNDLYNIQKDTAAAGKYARAVFLPSQISSLSTWATTGSRVDEIAIYKKLIAAYKTMDFDYFNIHWTEPRNGVDSVHAQVYAIQKTIQYYQKAIGKPVICNELGSHSMQPSLMAEMMAEWANNNADYVIPYSGTDVTTNASGGGNDVTLINNTDTSLNTIGTASKNQYVALKNVVRDIIKTNNGKPQATSIATGVKQPVWMDEQGNFYAGNAANGGSSTDTTSLSNRIDTKVDNIRRVGTNVQMFKNGTWTTVYTDSIGVGSSIDTTSLSNRINTKEDSYTTTTFATALQFNKNKVVSTVFNQTADINFTLSGTGNLVGKTIKFTINANTDTITIPNAVYWKEFYPQQGKVNDFELTYRADNSIDVKVSVRNPNFSNIITLDTNQTSFDTYDGYRMNVITVETNGNTMFSMGTAPGATDILKPEFLEMGSHTIYCKAIFYIADTVYINWSNGVNVQVSLPNPKMNNE